MPDISQLRRWYRAGVVLFALGLACCSAGQPSDGFVVSRLKDSYIPLSDRKALVLNYWAAAFAITPNVGVTNYHNLRFFPAGDVLAGSHDYDLLFFRIDNARPPLIGKPELGEEVIAYGQGASHNLREARGKVASLDGLVAPRCGDCPTQRAIVFDARAGDGFSGGPVVDAKSGAVVGITFGYVDDEAAQGGRRMYAYDMDLVLAEMRRLMVESSQQ